ncbi:hypothetical protein [Calothrix sp. UHCC 0171]|uniref:hypothetical protein n=1 Tax=Calothrix sp. UHCC 0171 TaxID=3110245 RepID=UPI002B206AB6|nr:hypothetical protein [Calothrix sp. UHCC 0171]MEA5570095.1 hypothetical protein [Calothrix sp. UHCC 0171]
MISYDELLLKLIAEKIEVKLNTSKLLQYNFSAIATDTEIIVQIPLKPAKS